MPPDIRRPLKAFLPRLLEAQQNNLNEADTVMRVIKVFEGVLGYDVFQEIGRETQLKNKYVDICIKLNGVIKLLVEVKAAGTHLRDRHIEQAQMYASRNNIPWAVLTNGLVWTLYHLTFDEGIEYTQAFSVDLADEDALDANAAKLALLHRDSLMRAEHESFFARQTALSPTSIGKALFNTRVLLMLRRTIRKSEGILIDLEDLAAGLRQLFSAEAREQIGPVKIRRSSVRRRKASPDSSASDAPNVPKEASAPTGPTQHGEQEDESGQDIEDGEEDDTGAVEHAK